MREVQTIEKNPVLSDALNYELLRQKGLQYIQQLGSGYWTDYNIHDPGITLLELLCFAITDLGYRTSFDIKDLLAKPYNEAADPGSQAFYTAKEILTVNPCTIPDYRKLLIDISGIKNAWLEPVQLLEDYGTLPGDEENGCMFLYADCKKSRLHFSQDNDSDPSNDRKKIQFKGLYDVKIEFEDDEGFGNLNSGRMRTNFNFPVAASMKAATLEMRLPTFSDLKNNPAIFKILQPETARIQSVTVAFLSPNKTIPEDVKPDQLLKALRRTLFATFTMQLDTGTVVLPDIPLRIWFQDDNDRAAITVALIKSEIENTTGAGILPRYLERIHTSIGVMEQASATLQGHRNLCEDYCRIQAVAVEDIGVCADVDVEIDVDIETVVAHAFFLIDEYFSPPIRFYSLDEMLAAGKKADEIFDGPVLENGFIDDVQLENTNLKKTLHASDIINLLMEIPGVRAVRNLSLVRYDSNGNIEETLSWSLQIKENRQPRLYIDGSKFLVFKNGLSFLPGRMELMDTLLMIRGEHMRPKFTIATNDLPVPKGEFYRLNDYQPLQYSLPLTYGVGYDGLPGTASDRRKAEARQLKGYLLFFEQLLVGYLEQLTHVKDLFTLDETILQTYFTRMLRNDQINGIEDLYTTAPALIQEMLGESNEMFLDRRNRFLDHMMARFAENFNEYALMLYLHYNNKPKTETQLILDKIAFIRDYPFISSKRGGTFNYADPALIYQVENVAGLITKIRRLLDFRNIRNFFELYEEKDKDGVTYERRWRLKNMTGEILLSSSTRYTDPDLMLAEAKALEEITIVRVYIRLKDHYIIQKVKTGTGYYFNLVDNTKEVIATRRQVFKTKALAEQAIEEIISFGVFVEEMEKIHIVEHLLLRPRKRPDGVYAGDPLLSICIPDGCDCCGEEDPYSCRMSIIINGEGGMANSSMEFRRFAERTIRLEVPAHLGLKICWVSTLDMQRFEAVYFPWLEELANPMRDAAGFLTLSNRLKVLLQVFESMKSVYPEARLHDCVDGDDTNRVFLNQTIITSYHPKH